MKTGYKFGITLWKGIKTFFYAEVGIVATIVLGHFIEFLEKMDVSPENAAVLGILIGICRAIHNMLKQRG